MADICLVFTMLSCLVFKWHLKTGPFEIQTTFHHSNTGLVRYSDLHCIYFYCILLPGPALSLAARLLLCPVVPHPSVAAVHAAVHAAVDHAHAAAAAVVVIRDGGGTSASEDGATMWQVTNRDDFQACCATV